MYGFSAIVGVFGTTTMFPLPPPPQRASGASSTPTKTGFHAPPAHAPCTLRVNHCCWPPAWMVPSTIASARKPPLTKPAAKPPLVSGATSKSIRL
eukprot:scaffold33662_cov49-Phaeocystis_antarctica.AAC.2